MNICVCTINTHVDTAVSDYVAYATYIKRTVLG
jgi:hypothetical protein